MTGKPDPYLWNCIYQFTPPKGRKLQFYTAAGTCIYGYNGVDGIPNFATHWANCLPSPSKQSGNIK